MANKGNSARPPKPPAPKYRSGGTRVNLPPTRPARTGSNRR